LSVKSFKCLIVLPKTVILRESLSKTITFSSYNFDISLFFISFLIVLYVPGKIDFGSAGC